MTPPINFIDPKRNFDLEDVKVKTEPEIKTENTKSKFEKTFDGKWSSDDNYEDDFQFEEPESKKSKKQKKSNKLRASNAIHKIKNVSEKSVCR